MASGLLPSSLPLPASSHPVLFTLSALHLLSDELLRLSLISAHTWRVETTYVLVFYEEHVWPWLYNLHMTLVAPKKLHSQEVVFEDLHWTVRKSVWSEDFGHYVDCSACSKHYDLIAGMQGKWVFGLVENKDAGNRQLSQDPDLEREGLDATGYALAVLETLGSLAERGQITVNCGKIVAV